MAGRRCSMYRVVGSDGDHHAEVFKDPYLGPGWHVYAFMKHDGYVFNESGRRYKSLTSARDAVNALFRRREITPDWRCQE